MNLNISTAEVCGKLRRKHLGVTSGHDNLAFLIGIKATEDILKTVNVLHLVNEQIILRIFFQFAVKITRKIICISYIGILCFFLIDIDDIGIRIVGFNLFDELTDYITLANATLPGKGDYHTLADKSLNMLNILLPCYYLHDCKDSEFY